MSRIRSIKPEFWTSAQVMECAPITRLFFIGLWNFCDDEGRHPVSEKQLKALIFPGDEIPISNIRGMLDELKENGLIMTYSVDGKEFFQVTGWRHQKIDKPQKGKFPEPPSPIRAPFDERSPNGIDGEDRKGKEGIVREANASLVNGAAADANVVEVKFDQKKTEKRDVLKHVGEWWNDLAGNLSLPQIEVIKPGSSRETHAWTRCREWLDDHAEISEMTNLLASRIRGSPFLRGEKGFAVTFDWLMNATNFQKVLEGNYEVRQAQGGSR